jgi:antitoxin ParD1/3/4
MLSWFPAISGGETMNVSIGERWQGFVDRVVQDGRYGSASEVVREGLRLVEEREAKLAALRAPLDASIALGGEVTDAELDADIAAKSAELKAQGLGA